MGTWQTIILDVLGPDADGSRRSWRGRYFWGTADLDGDGVPEVITSLEPARRPENRTRIELLDARTGEVSSALDDMRIVTVDDEDLPADRVFHADHHGAALLTDRCGRTGVVLVDVHDRTVWWHLGPSRDGGVRRLSEGPVVRVDARNGGIALGDANGGVLLLDSDLIQVAAFTVDGRTSHPLMRTVSGEVEVVANVAGGAIVGVRGGRESWRVPGDIAAIHRDRRGRDLLVIVTSGESSSAVSVRTFSEDAVDGIRTWDVPGPVDGVLAFGVTPIVLIQRRSGPHTAQVIAFDAHGHELWWDDERGVHASEPLAFADGEWRLATDDHGVLTIRDGLTGAVLAEQDWTAGYTTPLAVRVDGAVCVLRADGAHGMELCTGTGQTLWRRGYDLFSIFPGVSAALGEGKGVLVAISRKGGLIDVLRVRDGKLLNTLAVGEQPERRPVLGIGSDLLVGTLDGDVVAVDALTGAERWTQRFTAAVVELAGVVAGGKIYLSVSTADGQIHVMSSESSPTDLG